MKTKLLLTLTVLFFTLLSCDNEGDTVLVNVATPKYMALDEFRAPIEITSPVPILKSGKIYAYNNLVLINDTGNGIHIIDNEDARHPIKIAFIKVIATNDMEVRGNYLYVDSLSDLLVFDISDIHNIKEVSRLRDVFPAYIPTPVLENLVVDYAGSSTNPDDILVGWDITQERRRIEEVNYYNVDRIDVVSAEANITGGQGGSLSKFKIVDNYLYAVDSHNINIFTIDNLENPQQLNPVFAGFDIETIFSKGNYLFLGSMSGMYIYNIESPASPQYISEFQHGTACDPVVVDDNYAYITLRAGNNCGALDSSLQIVNITDIQNPTLTKSYEMTTPYGLGVNNNLLFICDGSSGLKVYDKTDVENLQLLKHFKDITTYEVIPLENHLLLIGDKVLYQYSYTDEEINLLSRFSLN